MKKLSFLVITGAILFCSCGNGGNEDKTKDTTAAVSNKEGEATVTQPDTAMKGQQPTVDAKCVEFVNRAINAGLKEVELGKWAKEYGTRSDVKDFGSMMVTDHTAAGEELKKIAVSKHITVPNLVPDAVRNDIDKMKTKKQGPEVDKAYVSEMVSDHKDAVKLFEDASKNATDADLKNFAAKTLPTLQHHLDAIQKIKAKM